MGWGLVGWCLCVLSNPCLRFGPPLSLRARLCSFVSLHWRDVDRDCTTEGLDR